MSDSALMTRYLDGDHAAFEELFRRHAPKLLAFIRREVRSQTDAEDLLQLTFLHVHRARFDFERGAPVTPWLYAIARNCILEHFRKASRRHELLVDAVPDLAARDRDPLTGLTQAEEHTALHSAISRLPSAHREVVALHWFAEEPFRDIASRLGASVSAVKVRAHRAYARLRADLDRAHDPAT